MVFREKKNLDFFKQLSSFCKYENLINYIQYTVKNNNQKLVQIHTKKCTRRNCTNFATKYKNRAKTY